MKVWLKFFPKRGADLSSANFDLADLCQAMQKGRTFKVEIMCDDLHRKIEYGEKYPMPRGHEDHLGRIEINPRHKK